MLSLALSLLSPLMLWIYGGEENIQVPDGSSNVARFTSLSIVPLLTAPKAFKGMMRRGLPSHGWNETFIVAVSNSLKLEGTLKGKLQIYISHRFSNRSKAARSIFYFYFFNCTLCYFMGSLTGNNCPEYMVTCKVGEFYIIIYKCIMPFR